VRLTVVGCSGSFPGPTAAASCYLVEVPHEGGTFRVVLDLGNGALGALQRFTDVYAVDAVLLSHLHADHCLDLTSYYVARSYRPGGPPPRLPVYGPDGTAERLARAYDLPPEPGMTGAFEFRGYPDAERGGELEVGPVRVTAVRVAHPVPCFALRLEHGGRVLAYTGDTGPTPVLVPFARGADLLLAEASFVAGEDNPPDLHLTGTQAGELARDAGVDRLVVTHVPPWHAPARAVAEASAVFAGPVLAAEPGQTHDI
jgi:ribonuclease BN (tRNA processing enzyme)